MDVVAIFMVCAGVAVLIGALWRASGEAGEAARRRGNAYPEPYHGVEICSTDESCAAACALHGKRFLSAQAPALPLLACSRRECPCVYMHFDDRRAGPRRQADAAAAQDGRERRVRPGRRAADRWVLGVR
ncbi:hypothetical protein E6C76_18855 [Pseudothauera nasutitermitis]|uniref:Uncharacterized protein n=1 Tax=Pseudothauera nasutitermitis TaxID=2565930 RepID=A0A4V3WB94_9RHOO|nr:hypothetical protein [Pseudothauera nasutitermitis]THF62377.1 hypothetical protein E6C76_18855 [Pseudothauera nasutitermitis]